MKTNNIIILYNIHSTTQCYIILYVFGNIMNHIDIIGEKKEKKNTLHLLQIILNIHNNVHFKYS